MATHTHISRRFPHPDAAIEVTFDWDLGDPNTGIPEGWGADTGIIFTAGPIKLDILFLADENKPVAEWEIDGLTIELDGSVIWDRDHAGTMAEHKTLLPAVEETWAQIQALWEVEAAYEAISDTWLDVSHWEEQLVEDPQDLYAANQLQQAKTQQAGVEARHAALKQAYDAKYQVEVAA